MWIIIIWDYIFWWVAHGQRNAVDAVAIIIIRYNGAQIWIYVTNFPCLSILKWVKLVKVSNNTK